MNGFKLFIYLLVVYYQEINIFHFPISQVFFQIGKKSKIYLLKSLKFKTVMSENASSRNSISWNWFCQGLVHTVPQDSCPTGTCPVGNCMNLSLAKPSSMILSSWKRYIHFEEFDQKQKDQLTLSGQGSAFCHTLE